MTRPDPPTAGVTLRAAVVLLRLAPAGFLLSMLPMVGDALGGAPGAAAELHARSADVLGKAALVTLLGSYAVTPIATVTGWRWHVVLRRDLALWTTGFALLDLLLAAALDEHGWAYGTSGKAGLAAGTLAALLLVPLALTSNKVSMRLLGRDWKRLHRLIHPVLALVAVHLFMVGSPLFGCGFLVVVGVLWLPRTRPVRGWLLARRAVVRP